MLYDVENLIEKQGALYPGHLLKYCRVKNLFQICFHWRMPACFTQSGHPLPELTDAQKIHKLPWIYHGIHRGDLDRLRRGPGRGGDGVRSMVPGHRALIDPGSLLWSYLADQRSHGAPVVVYCRPGDQGDLRAVRLYFDVHCGGADRLVADPLRSPFPRRGAAPGYFVPNPAGLANSVCAIAGPEPAELHD